MIQDQIQKAPLTTRFLNLKRKTKLQVRKPLIEKDFKDFKSIKKITLGFEKKNGISLFPKFSNIIFIFNFVDFSVRVSHSEKSFSKMIRFKSGKIYQF